MAGGVLTFTLGLQTNEFLKGINLSRGAVLGLASVGKLLESAFDRVWKQIEAGAALNDLSKRTGESVASLYRLRGAFKAAGLSVETVGPAIFMLNKALGGLNEEGEDTKSIFKQAGLSIEALKQMGSAGSIRAVLKQMSGMNQTSATAFAGSIFGRGGAADMVQASRSMDDFNRGLSDASGRAGVFAMVARLFDDISKAAERIKGKVDSIFLAVAQDLAPMLKALFDRIEGFDLSPILEGIHKAFRIVTNAFGDGKLGELISLSLQVGLEKGMVFGQRFAAALAAAIMASLPYGIKAGLELAKQSGKGLLGGFQFGVDELTLKALRHEIKELEDKKKNHPSEYTAQDSEDLISFKTQRKNLEYHEKTLASGLEDQQRKTILAGAEAIDSAMADAMSAMKLSWNTLPQMVESDAAKRLKALMETLNHFEGGFAPTSDPNPGEDVSFQRKKDDKGAPYVSPRSEIERMGFTFNSEKSATVQAASTTAKNTSRLVELSRLTLELLSRTGLFPQVPENSHSF